MRGEEWHGEVSGEGPMAMEVSARMGKVFKWYRTENMQTDHTMAMTDHV